MRFERNQDDHEDLNAFINYNDFPPLPNFPCISYSLSSSCSSAPDMPNNNSNKPSSSSASSSSVSSWIRSSKDSQEDAPVPDQALLSIEIPHQGRRGVGPLASDDYMDVMEEQLGDADWDPSTLFNCGGMGMGMGMEDIENEESEDSMVIQGTNNEPSEDLAIVFFEWLKSNKEFISAEDLKNIKIKKSTIECAVRRLGGGKEGMEQLLKLILEWVQNHQLQKKRIKEGEKNSSTKQQVVLSTKQNPNPNPNPNLDPSPSPTPNPSTTDLNSNSYLVPSMPQWLPHHHQQPPPPYIPDSPTVFPSMMYGGSMGEPVCNNGVSCQLYPIDRLVRLGPSATKVARMKRIARQKRFFSHSRRSHSQQHQQTIETRLAGDANCTTTRSQNPNNCLYWPSSPSTISSPASMLMYDPPPPVGDHQTKQFQRQTGFDIRQGFITAPEKNLKFILQKVLKQSDVGNLGRIVLPKKEAETYLPGLDARDGISIDMEDIGSSRIWNMHYRFWPNNKSRMYLLENTGEFVRSNGLQEGDFIVIYSDIKCGKYLIRGVKVREPGSKSEVKSK